MQNHQFFLFLSEPPKQLPDYTTQMLDAMQQLLMGGGEYDREFLGRLYPCMASVNPLLKTAAVRLLILMIFFIINYRLCRHDRIWPGEE